MQLPSSCPGYNVFRFQDNQQWGLLSFDDGSGMDVWGKMPVFIVFCMIIYNSTYNIDVSLVSIRSIAVVNAMMRMPLIFIQSRSMRCQQSSGLSHKPCWRSRCTQQRKCLLLVSIKNIECSLFVWQNDIAITPTWQSSSSFETAERLVLISDLSTATHSWHWSGSSRNDWSWTAQQSQIFFSSTKQVCQHTSIKIQCKESRWNHIWAVDHLLCARTCCMLILELDTSL